MTTSDMIKVLNKLRPSAEQDEVNKELCILLEKVIIDEQNKKIPILSFFHTLLCSDNHDRDNPDACLYYIEESYPNAIFEPYHQKWNDIVDYILADLRGDDLILTIKVTRDLFEAIESISGFKEYIIKVLSYV